MIGRLAAIVEEIEGRIFDAVITISIPLLIWWCQRGLKREDLSEELHGFWAEWRTTT